MIAAVEAKVTAPDSRQRTSRSGLGCPKGARVVTERSPLKGGSIMDSFNLIVGVCTMKMRSLL